MRRTVLLMILGILISPVLSVPYLNTEIVMAAPSNSYYVSNDGDDLNDGLSPATPWQTIGKVNTEMNGGVINAGDDIYLKRGDTWDTEPGVGGNGFLIRTGGESSSNPMVIGAYSSGAKPIIQNPDGVIMWLYEANLNDVIVQDLNLSDASVSGAGFGANQNNAVNITLRNLTVYDCANGIIIKRIDGYKIYNCDAISNGNAGIAVQGSSTYKICNGRIWNCTSTNNGNDGIQIHLDGGGNSAGANHWIKNCTVDGNGEDGFDISTGENVYVENCTSMNTGNKLGCGHEVQNLTYHNMWAYDTGTPSGDGHINVDSNNTIIRYCTFHKWGSGDNGITYCSGASSNPVNNSVFYNNDVIYNSLCSQDMIQIGNTDINTVYFKNNIVLSTENALPNRFAIMQNLATINANWSHNLWWRGDGGAGDDTWWYAGGSNYDLTGWLALPEVYGDLRSDPKLIDPVNYDYSLQSNSPAIDAGDWLTTTNGGGTGATITVHEANYFVDGYDISGLDGDNIFIGSNTDLEIIDIDYAAETITVNRSISWNDGDPVSLVYSGSAPDIGAYEYPSSGPNIIPPQISNVILTESNPLDTNPSLGWINITATVIDDSEVDTVMINFSCSNGSSFNVSMNAIGSTYYYRTSTMFSNLGNYSYYIWANDTNGNPSTSTVYDFSMPPNWDINNDGWCNLLDFNLIGDHFNEIGPNGWIREDVDNNGIVQVFDFVLLCVHYPGTCWWT